MFFLFVIGNQNDPAPPSRDKNEHSSWLAATASHEHNVGPELFVTCM